MKISPNHSTPDRWRWPLAALVLAVQACGGGGSDGASGSPAPAASVGGDTAAPVAVVTPPSAPAPIAQMPVAAAPAPIQIPLIPIPSVPAAPAPTATSSAPAPIPGTPSAAAGATTLIQLGAATTCSIPGMREAILASINLARASGHVCGTEIMKPVPPMAWNDVIFSAAARHSQDMATRNYFSHTTPDGVTFDQRLAKEGYGAFAMGENIAAGQDSVASVMSSWLSSEGHCRNIMQPLLNEVAVACVRPVSANYGTFWTMDMGGR